jgi:hypothetical protein
MFEMQSGPRSISITFTTESPLANSLASQDGSVPKTINRLRWAGDAPRDMPEFQDQRQPRYGRLFAFFFIGRQVCVFPAIFPALKELAPLEVLFPSLLSGLGL